MVQATCHLDPELSQQTPQHVHKLRTLPHQQIARPMQRQRRLLLGRLHRHEAHGWPRHRLTDRLSIPRIRLAPLHIGLHVGWRHQPHLVAKLCQLACPMMRGAASFHADKAGGKLGKERQNLCPPQRFADDNVSLRVDGMDLKDALGQIKPARGAPLARLVVKGLADQIGTIQLQLARLEKKLLAWHRSNELSQRLVTIPGIGVISATALAASVIEPERFRSGRQFAASLGLTPLQNCSGGRERMGRISRMGDRYLRRLLVVGMTSLVRRARVKPASVDPRLSAMLARKPARLVTVAAANRTARVAWAIMTRGGTYRAPISAAA